MQSRIVTALILLVAGIESCKKKEPDPIPHHSWLVGSDTYRSQGSVRLRQGTPNFGPLLYRIAFGDSAFVNQLSLDFFEPPVAGRMYRVGSYPDSANEVMVSYSGKSGSRIRSNEGTTQYLQVDSAGSGLRYQGRDIRVEIYTFVVNSHTTISMNVAE